MGLIERAVGEDGRRREGAASGPPQAGDAPAGASPDARTGAPVDAPVDASGRDMSASGMSARPASRHLSEDCPIFDLDLSALAGQGLYTPEGVSRRQALELRAIKRGLLKRAGLLHGGGRSRRAMHHAGRRRNIIVVTSARPGEGKTFTALNLALSFAFEDRQSVLLVDGDILRPSIRETFGIKEGPGLTDALADPSLPLSAIARAADGAPLAVVGEGTLREGATELFASDAARAFFAAVSAAAPDRLMIVDAPPMLATTEAFALAAHADQAIFVVQADATPEAAAAMALDELLEVNPNVGLVLNRCLIPGGGAHYGSYEHYDRRAPSPDRKTVG